MMSDPWDEAFAELFRAGLRIWEERVRGASRRSRESATVRPLPSAATKWAWRSVVQYDDGTTVVVESDRDDEHGLVLVEQQGTIVGPSTLPPAFRAAPVRRIIASAPRLEGTLASAMGADVIQRVGLFPCVAFTRHGSAWVAVDPQYREGR